MRIKILGLTFVVLLAFGAPAALAASQGAWKVNGEELTAKHNFKAEGTIEIEESHFGNGYSCPFVQEGTVGPGTVGEITGKKVFSCTYRRGTPCESAIELEALNLPWKTELTTVNGVLRDEIKSGGSGTPEWMVKCKGPAGKYEILCTGAETSTRVRSASEGVQATFDGESAKGSCVLGGSKTLGFKGSEIVKLTEGAGLLGVEATEWFLNSEYLERSVEIASKGKLTFSDVKVPLVGKMTVECTSTDKSVVGLGGGGEVTAVTLSACKGVSVCESNIKVTAEHLPWRTTLATSEGATRDLISEDGNGAPGFKLVCKQALVGELEDVCTNNTSASVKNVTGGVDETFDSQSAKLNCTLGGSGEGEIEGTDLLENPSGDTLSFKT